MLRGEGAVASSEPGRPPQLRIRVAHGLAVDGLEERSLGSRKARTALKLLAIARGRAVSSDRLADVLWGDRQPRDASGQLAVIMSRLRRVVGGDRITHGDNGYTLHADWLDIDAAVDLIDEARRALETGRVEAAFVAAMSARSLLDDASCADDVWSEADRRALERAVVSARHCAARTGLAAGEVSTAVEVALAALDTDAYDEESLRLAMAGMAALGRVPAALAVYERVRGQLADELGTSPSAATDAVHRALLKGLPAPGVAIATPPALGAVAGAAPLIGRDDELGALDSLFASVGDSGPVVAVIEGEPGIGKTALVEAWIRRLPPDVTVLPARCDQLSGTLPLQPVLQLLRRHIARASPAPSAALGGDAPLLGPLLHDTPSDARPSLEAAQALASSPAGLALLTAALRRVIVRLCTAPGVVFIDDVHRADAVSVAFIAELAMMERIPILIVLARRTGEGLQLPSAHVLTLQALTLDDVRSLVGEARAATLHQRSDGNPLFLTELARADRDSEMPPSVQALAAARIGEAGAAADTLQAAAVLGSRVDLDLLAEVLVRNGVGVLGDLDAGARLGLLDEREGAYVFRHELLREALEGMTPRPRRRLLHREGAVALARRPQADPMEVAYHARLCGAGRIAAEALTRASRLAADRFDYATAETLATEAIAADDIPAARSQRAVVLLRQARYDDARHDAEEAVRHGDDPDALEVAGAVAYYCRDFGRAATLGNALEEHAHDAVQRVQGIVVRARALHAAGDVAAADGEMRRAVELCAVHRLPRPVSVLAFLRVHVGDARGAVDAIRASPYADRDALSTVYTPVHAQFTLGYALATCGEAGEALRVLDRASTEAQRRGLTRYISLGANMCSWVLRNIGEVERARDHNAFASSGARNAGYRELEVYATLDPCDDAIAAGAVEEAEQLMASARDLMREPYAYSWRHRLRLTLLEGRCALVRGDRATARRRAAELITAANDRRALRYVVLGKTLQLQTGAGEGARTLRDAHITRLSETLGTVAGVEAWWLLGEIGAAWSSARCFDLAAQQRDRLVASLDGDARERFVAYAAARLVRMRSRGRTG
ncbi:MAG TPA: AAA family ATPase [Candidatus Dormibacteraeota bacterium]